MVVNKLKINERYMSWLDNFTITHSSFHDDEFLFCSNEETKEDKENALSLNDLYYIIREYARNNNIKINDKDNVWQYYVIKHNNNYYKIGIEIDAILLTKEIEVKEPYIEFNKVLKKQNKLHKSKNL